MTHCVSCGVRMINPNNHKCSEKHEATRKAAIARAINEDFMDFEPRTPTEASRLFEGLYILETQDA